MTETYTYDEYYNKKLDRYLRVYWIADIPEWAVSHIGGVSPDHDLVVTAKVAYDALEEFVMGIPA